MKKPQFSNSRGVQNKDAPLSTTTSSRQPEKPQFTNSKGVQNKDTPLSNTTKVADKLEAPKKFTGSLNKNADENAKIKAPNKDYLEGDSKNKYKEETQSEIEKPKFVNKNVEGNEPHFKEINKNEDVIYF